jgi:hypothetical protein
MANLTKAQRHNKMLENIFVTYREQQGKLPPIQLYSRFLEIAKEKLLITIEEARAKYGLYTVQEWETILKLGWNK